MSKKDKQPDMSAEIVTKLVVCRLCGNEWRVPIWIANEMSAPFECPYCQKGIKYKVPQ